MLQTDQVLRSKVGAGVSNRLIQACLIVGSVIAVLYYIFATGWTVLELPRVLIGVVALWGPAAALTYLVLREQVPDKLARFTLSAIVSYALTTLAYFGASALGITPLFYVASTGLTIGIAAYLVRTRAWTQFAPLQKLKSIDWILIALIAASLVVNIRYQTVYSVSPETGTRSLLLNGDQTYYTSQVYELARHDPPLQQSIEAGMPERAYHMFPHLTTMLVAQFTGQGDALRAHLVYEYAIIEILFCLVFYCLGKMLTRSRWGGYISVALLYIFAVPFLPLIGNSAPYFFFTFYPYPTSGLEPLAITSPQTYSGLLVLYGIMLSVVLISTRSYTRQRVTALLIFAALMVGAMLRFRIQIFMPLILGFLLLACYGLWRTRQRAYLAAMAVAILVSALLYIEMQSPVYLENTTRLVIGNNGLTLSANQWWFNSWPFSDVVRGWLSSVFQDKVAFAWAWQIVSMLCFLLFNVLGIPLFLASVVYLRSKPASREWKLYTGLTVWLLVVSTIGAMVIATNYDNYSVGGQMLLHTSWYLLPLMAVGVWHLFLFLKAHISWSRQVWAAGIALVVLITVVYQQVRPPTLLQAYNLGEYALTFSANEWSALSYIHDSTPQESVIISNKHLEPDMAVFSGIGGRAGYYEYTLSILNNVPSRLVPQEDRRERIRSLWSATSPDQFCRLLTSTVATDLVEYSSAPLLVQNATCIQQLWSSSGPGEKVVIWSIKR